MSRARNLSDVGGISYITATGNKVGIGTNSPGTKLDVTETGSTSCIIRTKNDTTSVYLDANNGYAYLNCFSNHPLLFGTNNAERMRITSDGKFGLGIGNPSAKAEIYYTSTAPSLSSSSGAGLALYGSSTLRINFGSDPSSPYGGWIQSSNNGGTALPLCLNPLGGNIGINTATANAPLVLYNTSASMRFQNSNTGTSNNSGLFVGLGNNNSTAGYVYNISNNALVFGTNNAERVRITNDGKVLINTTDTNALITVKHTSTAIGGGVQLIKATEDNRWELLVGGDNKLYLAYGSATTPSAVGNFATNGTYTATSDERKKKDISYQFDGLSLIAALKPAMGKMLEDKEADPMRPMLIAQDVVNVLPSAVSALDPDPDAIDPILGVDYSAAIPVLIKALQESIERVEALETEVAALKGN